MVAVTITLHHNPLLDLDDNFRNPPIGNWLRKNVKNEWIAKVRKVSSSEVTGNSELEIDIDFQDANDAMLFTLTWI